LSPQSRRGKSVSSSHHKHGSHGSSHAAPKPAATPPAPEQLEADSTAAAESETAVVSTAAASTAAAAKPIALAKASASTRASARKVAPARRSRRIGRLTSSPAYGYIKAYIPLIIAFLIVFSGFWAWTSFGPHSPTPQENWSRIETKWFPIREDARTKVTNSMNDFQAQLDGYKAYADATRGWATDLSAITDWSDKKMTKAQNDNIAAEMQQFITAATQQADLLDIVAKQTSAAAISAMGQDVISSEQTFNTTFANVRYDLMGSATITLTPGPELVVPSVLPTCTPAPSVTPTATPSPTPSGSQGPTGSPTATPTASPTTAGSPAPSATVFACSTPVPSAVPSVSPVASVTVAPSPSPSPSK
jgi:hypothetical protein